MGHIWSMSAPLSIWQKRSGMRGMEGFNISMKTRCNLKGSLTKKIDQITVGLFLHRYKYIPGSSKGC